MDGTRGEGTPASGDRVDLYWLPLGAGGPGVVRWSGRAAERLAAAAARRRPCDLYHAGLVAIVDDVAHAIEMAPAWGSGSAGRGVVAQGAVGHPVLGRSRWFRYEVRCRAGGRLPDAQHAVGGPRTLPADPACAAGIVALVARCPAPTWGRDELAAGEGWTSNSLVAWLLVTSGVDLAGVGPPVGGRAPGWSAGVRTATRARAGDVGPAR